MRTVVLAMSKMSCSAMRSLLMASWMIGTSEALYSDDQRRLRARRKRVEHGLGDRRHLGHRFVNIGVRVEENLDDADAVERLALGVLDAADGRGEDAFVHRGDARFHVARRHAGIIERHRDHRDIDFRKDVRRHAHDGQHAEDEHEHRRDDERVRPTKSKTNDPHRKALRDQSIISGFPRERRAGAAGDRHRCRRFPPASAWPRSRPFSCLAKARPIARSVAAGRLGATPETRSRPSRVSTSEICRRS